MNTGNSVLTFFVNGKKIIDANVNPEWTLLIYLRNKLSLCGTKLACGEGGCGACTVMVSKYIRAQDKIIHYPVNACLAPVCSMHGLAVTTVEGIGSTKTRLHPVQERIAKAHGSQCGFCTPGIVMSMYALLRNLPKPKMEDLEVAFQGNLCRCTGYRPIIEGYKTFTEDWELMQAANGMTNGNLNGNACGMGDKCCKLKNGTVEEGDSGILHDPNKFIPYDSSQEPIFPPELKMKSDYDTESLIFKSNKISWYRPNNIDDLLQLKLKFPQAKIVVGNTEVGVEVKFKNQLYPVIIQPTMIDELKQLIVLDDRIKIGAAVTLDDIETTFKSLMSSRNKSETKICKAVLDMLHWFAGKQIRSVASIGGNIMTGSPISDLNPIWMAARANLKLRSLTGSRTVTMDEHFYIGYRKTLLYPNEILESIEVPFTKANQYFFAHKQARRRDDDIAIVNSAMNITLNQGTNHIEDIEMAFGGMAPTTILAKKTKQLIGLQWNEEMLERAYSLLLDELPLSANSPGGMVDYRRSLPMSFFFRSFLTINQQLNLTMNPKDLSAINSFSFKPPKSSQYFQVVDNKSVTDTIGRPIVHTNALNQATGEAMYTDDIPKYEHELHLALIYSQKAHAKIVSIDTNEALKMDNVVDCILANDFPGDKNIAGLVGDEQFIRTETVTSQYQVLGGILATDLLSAQQAAKAVKVIYEELQPVIVTIDQAIEHNSFYDPVGKLAIGNTDEAFKKVKHIITGETRTGYQEHFYLEPQAYLAIPKEGQEFEMYCASQDHNGLAETLAKLLNVDQNKVIVKIKRIGGAFGGKETTGRKYACYPVIAAKKTNRPVRLVLERDEDMGGTGGRNAFLVKYKLGFNEDGKIEASEVEIFANGGHAFDMSFYVVLHGMSHITNSSMFANVKAIGRACKTNLPSNTAFRGFGNPQAMFAAEYMLREVAEFLKKSYVDVARVNLFREGDLTPYNQPIIGCNVRRCFEECLVNSDFARRKAEIEQFNRHNRWKKRGIDLVTTTYGVGYGIDFCQQAGALILVYKDGSVLLAHGGVEMGQGLHTKLIQVASRVLNIPIEKIHTNEVGTDKVPNTTATAASIGSDFIGMAVMDACNKINTRLEPVKAKNPDGTWEEWIQTAWMQRINLSANGFYAEPEINWDWTTSTGNKLYNYFTFGAACTEVEIDCLTGDHQVLRTDIVMDLGNSLNPAIDIGQVEGGFMQGYGLYCLEEMVTSPDGTYMSKGPGAYKIPGFNDIPIEFNVALLKDSSNPKAMYSSKAIGEPPLFLASSALFAIREAIKAARNESGVDENFKLNAPATAEHIRMACQDHITSKIQHVKSTWKVEQL